MGSSSGCIPSRGWVVLPEVRVGSPSGGGVSNPLGGGQRVFLPDGG